MDGSSAISDSDKKAELCLSAFFVATSTSVEPSELTQLRSAIAGKKPLALMGLNVKLGDNRSLEVTTARDFYCFVAQGAKAEEMAPTCDALLQLSPDAKCKLSSNWVPSNFSDLAFVVRFLIL